MNPPETPQTWVCFVALPGVPKNDADYGWNLQVIFNPDHRRRPMDDCWSYNCFHKGEIPPTTNQDRIWQCVNAMINHMLLEACEVPGETLQKREYISYLNFSGRAMFDVRVLVMQQTAKKLQEYAYDVIGCPREPSYKEGPITDQEMRNAQAFTEEGGPSGDVLD
jgi:hypothetical protein